METDPDAPDYRYPEPGERLWHRPWRRWVIVRQLSPLEPVRAIPDDEVPVRLAGTDELAVVKLRSLVEPDYRATYTVTTPPRAAVAPPSHHPQP